MDAPGRKPRKYTVFFFKPRKKWAVQWTEDGKKKRRYCSTESEAYAYIDECRQKETTTDKRLMLGELMIYFFRAHPDYHPRTKEAIFFAICGREDRGGEHIEGPAEFLREKYAEALTRRDLERLREELRKRKCSNNTINKHQAYIRAILAWGADQELISFNPWRDFKRLPVKRKEVATSLNEMRLIYEKAPDWLKWAMFTMYALTLRAGRVELFGLMWTAFDWRRGLVRVRQAKSGMIKTVYPPVEYMKIAATRYQQDMAAGIPWVCHRAGRKVICYRTAWDKAVADAGIPHVPMTHIRHVSVSEMLSQTGDLTAVAAQAGHSTPSTTGTFYAHAQPAGQKRAAALLPPIVKTDDKKP